MVRLPGIPIVALLLACPVVLAAPANSTPQISVRTEQYPRPPYSGATYFIYERGGTALCTKLKVCNKFDDCTVSYHSGRYKDAEDQETGEPYGTSPPMPIPHAKLSKHVCLVRHRLAGA